MHARTCQANLPLLMVSLTEFGDRVLEVLAAPSRAYLTSAASPDKLPDLLRHGLDSRRQNALRNMPPQPEFVFLARADELDRDAVAPKLEMARHCLRRAGLPGAVGMLLATDVFQAENKCEAVAAWLLSKPWLSYLVLLDTMDSAGRCLVGKNAAVEIMQSAFHCIYRTPLAGPLSVLLHSGVATAEAPPEERCFALGIRRIPWSVPALRRVSSRMLFRNLTERLFALGLNAIPALADAQPIPDYLETVWHETGSLAAIEAAANTLVPQLERRLQDLRAQICSDRTRAEIASLCTLPKRLSFWQRLVAALAGIFRRRSAPSNSSAAGQALEAERLRLEADQLYLGRTLQSIAELRGAMREASEADSSPWECMLPVALKELLTKSASDFIGTSEIPVALLPWQALANGQPAETLAARIHAYCGTSLRDMHWASHLSTRDLLEQFQELAHGIGVSWPRPGLARRHRLALVPDTIPMQQEGVEVIVGTKEEILFVEVAQGIPLQL